MEPNQHKTAELPPAAAAGRAGAGASSDGNAERSYTYRALWLAVLVEVVSCAGIFGDSFSRTTAEALANIHVALNLPVYTLLYLLRAGPVLQIQNHCLRLDNPVSLAIIAAQCGVWTVLFSAVMQIGHRLRIRLFR